MANFSVNNLPFLVFQEVLKSMEPTDLITYSTISSKTKKTVKSFTRSKKKLNPYKIGLRICRKPVLSIGSESVHWVKRSDKWLYRIKNFRCEGAEIFSEYHGETDLDEFKEWAEYIQDILNCPRFHKIILDTDAFPEQNQSIIDWLESRSKTLESIQLKGTKNGDAVVAQVTEKLKISQNLDISLKLSNQFQGTLPKEMFQIVIKHGQWITVDQLLTFDPVILRINHNALSVENLNVFFRAWMAKEVSKRMTYFEAYFKYEDWMPIHDMLDNLPAQAFDMNVVRKFIVADAKVTVFGGWDVRRVDGAIATLLFPGERNSYLLKIVMIVH